MEEFCDGAANLVVRGEELAKTRRVTRHDYVSVVKSLLRKLASCSGVFRSTRDEGRSFFACTGRKKHMEGLTSPSTIKTGLCGISLLLASQATELQYGAFVILSSDTVAQVH